MRAFFALAGATLALAACGSNGGAGSATNGSDSVAANDIVANDVTAIDAVTGDAANMAADVPITNDLGNGLDTLVNKTDSTAAEPATTAKRAPRKAAPAPANNIVATPQTNSVQ